MEITKGIELDNCDIAIFLYIRGKNCRAIFFVRNMFLHLYKEKEKLADRAYLRLYHELINYMRKYEAAEKNREPLEYEKYLYHIEAFASVITSHEDYFEKHVTDEEIEAFLAFRKRLWKTLD